MANIELAIIAHRQRSYLLRDLVVAVLMVLFVVFQVSAFTSASSGGSAMVFGAAEHGPPALTSERSPVPQRSAAATAEECTDPSIC